ncbi:formylglycine-generating enzyme [Gammaproteobacteria bacterium]
MAETQTTMVDAVISTWLESGCPSPLAVNEKDGSVLVYVPAGAFDMGDKKNKDSPRHRVYLSAYWIGVYCVTNPQYLRFVEANRKHWQSEKASYGITRWPGKHFSIEKSDHPAAHVNWDHAQEYAHWAGCELPTEAQWEKAARGPLGLRYPWGKDWDKTKCRHDKNRSGEETCPVYDFPGGVSGYGTYNQSGNVWEWCADWYDRDYYQNSPTHNPKGPEENSGSRVNRGGSWGDDDALFFQASRRYGFDTTYRDRSRRGFRLVKAAS